MRCLPPEMVAAPSLMPVSLAEAKAHLRVDHGEDDGLIEAAIAAAVGHLDGYGGILGRAMLRQDWRQYLPLWPASRTVELVLAPALAIVEVSARLADGSAFVLAPERYRLVGAAGIAPRLLIGLDADLPPLARDPDAVAITFRAGYGEAAETVPAPLRAAMLLMVGDLYRFPETVAAGAVAAVPMSATVDRLVGPYRRLTL